MAETRGPRLLFVSPHSYIDPSSGAAIATRDLLESLASQQWDTRVLCGHTLDFERDESLYQLLRDQRIRYRVEHRKYDSTTRTIVHYLQNQVPVAVCLASSGSGETVTPEDAGSFLVLLEEALVEFTPQIVLTYGGGWISQQIHERARRRRSKVVFALHNFAYGDKRLFDTVDAVLVPSQFAADWYRRNVGIQCTAIASPLNLRRVQCEPAARQSYVTFVNPQPAKGAFVFARIANEIGRCRPDIPLLVVEGRGGVHWLGQSGVELRGLTNVSVMANTPDPRDFYRVTRLILMPSLCTESFGRVAAEAMANGIPVLASDRGAIPEVLAGTGRLFSIPDRLTPTTRDAATAEEVDQWVQAIIELWDNDDQYEAMSVHARQTAEKWHPEQIIPAYDTFFRELINGV